MKRSCWAASADGAYWIEILVGRQNLRVMIDLGFTDPNGVVGMALQSTTFDSLKKSSWIMSTRTRHSLSATGQASTVECGRLSAQVIDSHNGVTVGPAIRVQALRGAPNVPHRVGVVFFHHLAGCRVVWELDQKQWCIEYP